MKVTGEKQFLKMTANKAQVAEDARRSAQQLYPGNEAAQCAYVAGAVHLYHSALVEDWAQ